MRIRPALITGAVGALLAGLLAPTAAATAAVPTSGPAPVGAPHAGGLLPSGRTVAVNTDGLTAAPSPSGGFRAFAATPLPTSVDLTRWAVPPGDQKTLGSCVTWAIGYSMLGWYETYAGHSTTFAPMYLYSQDKLGGKDDGSTTVDAYRILATQGITPRSGYSQGDYNDTSKPTTAEKKAAEPYRTTAPHYLYATDESTPSSAEQTRMQTAIETAVAAKHPVALAIPIFDEFEYLTPKHDVLTASAVADETPSGGHAVLVLGYDQSGVRIENQWGTRWGDQGFATLSWSFVKQYSYEASWISGFQSATPPSGPAGLTGFQVAVAPPPSPDGTVTATASWTGTADYEDALRHPVSGYVATLTDSNGVVVAAPPELPSSATSVAFSALDPSASYTVTVTPEDLAGPGPSSTQVVDPTQYVDDAFTWTQPDASDSATPDMPAAKPLPTSDPAAPATGTPRLSGSMMGISWALPTMTGHRSITAYRVTVVGRSSSGAVHYRHTYTVSAKHRSWTASFHSSSHRSSAAIARSLHSYLIEVQTENAGHRWSTATESELVTSWSHGSLKGAYWRYA